MHKLRLFIGFLGRGRSLASKERFPQRSFLSLSYQREGPSGPALDLTADFQDGELRA